MLIIVFRSLFFVVVVIGYSAGVWRLINDYFRHEMKTFIEEEAKNNKYLLEDPIRREVPPVVAEDPNQPSKPVTSNQIIDELILNFGRLFTTRNEDRQLSNKQETHQTLPPTISSQFSRKVDLPSSSVVQLDPGGDGGGVKSMPQGQQIEFSPPKGSAAKGDAKTIIESDEFPRSSTITATVQEGEGEEEWVQYWIDRKEGGEGGEGEQCHGSVIDSCELNLVPSS